jgi:hypothetical protein
VNDLELLSLHLDVLFVHDARGRLLRINSPNQRPAPRFYLGLTSQGVLRRFRHDVSARILETLKDLSEPLAEHPDLSAPLCNVDLILDGITVSGVKNQIWQGPAFYFEHLREEHSDAFVVTCDNAHVLRTHFQDCLETVQQGQPLAAVVVDGDAVSICCSGRYSDKAHEAGVETVASFRGRGYACEAVRVWAAAVAASGNIPLYSTSWENAASRAVARKLGLIQYGIEFHVT